MSGTRRYTSLLIRFDFHYISTINFSDLFLQTRGKAIALFTLAPFAGPSMGPVVGGYIGVSKTVSWRYVFFCFFTYIPL